WEPLSRTHRPRTVRISPPNERNPMFTHARALLVAALIGTIGLVTACSTSGDLDSAATTTTVADTTPPDPQDDITTITEDQRTTTTDAGPTDRDEIIDELTE